MLKLVIGNRNYSSWSLRAWLFLRESGVEFEEIRLAMFTNGWARKVLDYSPAGRVPVLVDGANCVWDSWAIIETVREKYSATVDWPVEPAARALARSISAEMHSGFLAVRDELPQNVRRRSKRPDSEWSQTCNDQIERIVNIWTDCRNSYGAAGRWLFGDFSIADVMFAPVALRFLTYAVSVPPAAAEFVASIDKLPSIREWCNAAAVETENIDFIDRLAPAADSPLTLG